MTVIRDSPCTGKCCERFTASGAETLQDALMAVSRSGPGEAQRIWDLLIVLPTDKPYQEFTCRHYDTQTKLCGIYEYRPYMCSAYPYDGVCKHCGMVFAASSDEGYQITYPLPTLTEDKITIDPPNC